jgi:hypothetical protein
MKKDLSFRNLKKLSWLTAFCFLAIFFSACNKNNDNAPAISYGNIAGINATENSIVDFYINNTRTNSTSITPGQAIGYFSVLPTSNFIDFKIAGTSSMIGSTSITAVADNLYSVFLGDGGAVVTVQDDRTTLPQTGKARIYFINMSPYLTGPVDFGGTGASNKIITGIALRSPTNYLEVDPSINSISIYNAGSSTPVFSVPVSILAGHIYAFYVAGTTSGTLTGKLLTQL